MNIEVKNKKAHIIIKSDYVSMNFINNPENKVYYSSLDCCWFLSDKKIGASHQRTEHAGLDYFNKHLFGKEWENIPDAITASKLLINYVADYCSYAPIINEVDDEEFKKLVDEVYVERAKKDNWE